MPAGGERPVVLRLAGITKRFGKLVANDAIDLELRAGEVMALLGENGAGKTTLMSILFGHYVADAGEVAVADAAGRLEPLPAGSPGAALARGVGMVHQHFTLADNLSVLENITLGTEPLWRWRRRSGEARRLLDRLARDAGLEVPLDVRVGSLSVGQQQRVEILKALYRGARILILDEPTAVLTPQETDALFATLRRLAAQGMAVIFISHKLGEVMALSERVAVLRGGRKVAELATAATDRETLAETMVGRKVATPKREPMSPGAPLVELRGVSARLPGRTALERADLTVHAHQIVGIAGVSGNGQQALSAVLAGLVAPAEGELRLAGGAWPGADPTALTSAGIGRIPEDRHLEGVVGDMTAAENLALEDYAGQECQRWGILRGQAVRARAERLIAGFDVRGGGPDHLTRLLSGGNMQKLILARVLERDPRFILANQPTRGLDIGAVTYVHDRLLEARRRGAGVLLISEELEELLTLADRIAVIYRGRLSAPIPTESLTVRELGLMMAGQSRHAA
ncbi:ABC transporter ATP-binding protein [Geminicoccaceae bacterium 1502E]|nr:ABC transporter ATP-binding protein [Geminicoccaceae bacterium 1502E]